MKAMICGVTGQDGAYLAKHLLGLGYTVFGTSRDAQTANLDNLIRLNVANRISFLSMDIVDFRSVMSSVDRVQPNEIYNLAGQTSVGLSFEQPVEAMKSIGEGALNLLEAIRYVDPKIKFFNASSSDCFGNVGKSVATESTPFNPCSPYGVAKSTAHFLVKNYREAFGLFACSGILFNHESPLRPQHFVTQKIVTAASRISRDPGRRLKLGNLDIARDWGWAPDYVAGAQLMLQQACPDDYILATGKTISLQQFVERSFAYFDLDWNEHVDIDTSFMRPSDLKISRGSADKAGQILDWSPTKDVDGVIEAMCMAALESLENKSET